MTGAVVLGQVGQAPHLAGLHPADGYDRADVVATALSLFVNADVAVLDGRMTRLALIEWKLHQRKGELLLRLFDELRDSPFINQVFQAGLLAIRAAAALAARGNRHRVRPERVRPR